MILALALHMAAAGQRAAPVPLVSVYDIRNNALPYEDRRIRVCGVLEYDRENRLYYLSQWTEYDIAVGVYLSARPRGARIEKRTCTIGRIVFTIPRAKRDLTKSYVIADSAMDGAYSLVVDDPHR